MIDVTSLGELQTEIRACISAEDRTLSSLRTDVRQLKSVTRRIHAHSTTSISLVGTDGGNNQVKFDPFLVQVIRVVDSSNNEYCLEAITPRTAFDVLQRRHLNPDGSGRTAFGRMMEYLGVQSLYDLSMISRRGEEPTATWVQVYRELTEWAILFDIVRNRHFGTDTVIIRDGFLRSKVFAGDLFRKLRKGIEESISDQYKQSRRRIYIAGVAKHSDVLQVYQLAMAIEGILRTSYPAYTEVPRWLEEKVYKWAEYARGTDREMEGREPNRFVAGKMFFVKFGNSPHDPVWAIDLLESQAEEAGTVLGYMLGDAVDGFPIPFYPQSLQRAHENAVLVDFDMDILQDEIVDAVRRLLGDKNSIIDEFRLQDTDVASRRYG